MDHYVYLHLSADSNMPFYVGKGRGRRAWSLKSRNAYWKNYVNKHGFIVQILKDGLSEADALRVEIEMIAIFGRRHLTNLTDGGEGSSGYIATEATRLKISRSNSNPSPEVRARKSRAATGRTLSAESRLKISLGKRNPSAETRARMSAGRKGRICTDETRLKLSKSIRGRKLSDDWKSKIGKANYVPIRIVDGPKFESAKFAKLWLGMQGFTKADASSIVKCCKGKLKSAYSYQWEYVTD